MTQTASVLRDDERCTARVYGTVNAPLSTESVRCGRRAEADGFCTQHHPLRKMERDARRQQEKEAAQDAARLREVFARSGAQLFWCQVAICALLQYLTKASPEYADALVRKL